MVTSVRTTLRPAYIVDGVRTPMGKAAGALATVRADDLASHVIEALVARHPACADRLDHVIFGAINQAGEDNRNVARMATLIAGLPHEIPAVTVNRLCGSGLEAIADAARMIAVGEADCVIAGGVESMTRAPYVMAKPSRAFDRKVPEIFDTSLGWRFVNPRLAERYEPISMGETAENVAKKYSVSREAQDVYAAESHQRAAAATRAGAFADEIVPVSVPRRKGEPIVVTEDECIRPDCSADGLAKLKPVFRKDGTVTAGNASPINDGAAATLVVSGAMLEECGLPSLGRLIGTAAVGVDPATMGEGPIYAVRKLLKRANLRSPMIDLVELNEAFAAQALACVRALELPPERVNVHGGAIALGHPIGCSGARIMVTLVHAMKQRDARLGLASLCIGVGQGIATLVERS